MAVARQKSNGVTLLFAAAVAIGGFGGLLLSHRVKSLDPFTGAVIGMAAGAGAVTCLLVVEPAVILTGGLLLSVFSGSWRAIGIPIPLDRVAMACGIATVLVRSIRNSEGPRIRPVHWLMLLLLLYAIASAAWADTLTSHGPLFALLDRLGLVPFLLFLIAPIAFRTQEQRRVLAIGMLAMGAYLGLTSLFEAVGAKSLVIPHYITNPALGLHYDRSRGPFLEAGANGLAMFNCFIAGAITLPYWRGRPRVRTLVIGIMILCVGGMVFTLTRQVWVGAALGALVAMLCDRRLRRWVPGAAVGAVLTVLVALAFVPGLQHSVNSRANDQGSVWDRLNSDAAALRMVAARPALGFGWGNFGKDSVPYYRLAATYPLSSITVAHNMPLSNAAELGLLGAGLWLVIVLMGVVAPAFGRAPPSVEPWRLALIAGMIAWFIQSNLSPLDYAFDNYVIWLWAGIVLGGRERAPARSSEPLREAARALRLSPA
jgi:putative inorganic carbon (hco3(-)) transporter